MLHTSFSSKKLALLAAMWATVALSTASAVYFLRSSDTVTRAQGEPTPPGTDVTPAPGTTPDTSEPLWYVPYLNQERDRPKFEGTMAGVAISRTPPQPNGFRICPSGLEQVAAVDSIESARNASAVRVDDRALPDYLTSTQIPEVWLCQGNIVDVSWVFAIAPGTPGADAGGGTATIIRTKGRTTAAIAGSTERWAERPIGSRAGATMAPVLEVGDHVLGQCAALSLDPMTGVLTQVIANGGTTDLCTSIAQEVQR
jgi:hypothetical protein